MQRVGEQKVASHIIVKLTLSDLNADTGDSMRATAIFGSLFARSAVLRFRPSERSRYAAKSKNNYGEHKDGIHRHSLSRPRMGGFKIPAL